MSPNPATSTPRRTLRLSDLRDQWLLTLVGSAIAVVVAANAKFLLIPNGLATLVWTFAAGLLFGALSFIAVAVYMFSEAAKEDDLALRSGPSALSFNPCDLPEGGEACIPPWAARGVMEGTVWTVAGSQWEDSDTLPGQFPPEHAGEKACCLKWHARVSNGALHMFQDPTNTLKTDYEVKKEIRVPLKGVSVDLLHQATKGKSQWFRKAPMKLILPSADTGPYPETTFVLFSMDSAAKEQWYLALVWGGCDPDQVPLGLEAQRLYSVFCAHLRPVAPVPIPKVASARSRAAHAANDAMLSQKDPVPRRGWWGARAPRKPARGSMRSLPNTPHSSRAGSAKGGKNVIEDMELQWAGGQRPAADKKGKSLKARRGHLATIKTSPSMESITAARNSPATLLAAPDLPSPPADPVAADLASADPFLRDAPPAAADWPQVASAPVGGLHPAADILRKSSIDSGQSTGPPYPSPPLGSSPVSAAGLGSQHFNPGAMGSAPELSAGHGPTQLAGLHAVNMFITRIAFDLMRSERFHAAVRDRLMTRLANIKVPNYITPLRLVGLDLGSTPPFIRSAHSLPSPGKTIWPRLVMHVVYHGKCTLTVETNVDFKDSAGFVTFERAMEVFGGSDASEASDMEGDALFTANEGIYGSSVDEAQLDSLSTDGAAQPSSSPPVSRAGGSSPDKAASRKKAFFSMKNMPFRKQIATSVRNVAGLIAEHVSKMPMKVDITITELDGPVLVWLAPPPSTGLWISFLEPPKLKLICRPVVSNRMIKYTAQAVSLSGWIESKMKSALQKNMVFPACSDLNLKFLVDMADLGTPAVLPLVIPKQPSNSDIYTSEEEGEREKASRPPWAKNLVSAKDAAPNPRAAQDEVAASSNAAAGRAAPAKPPRRMRKASSKDSLKAMAQGSTKEAPREAPAPPSAPSKRGPRPLWRRILRIGLPRDGAPGGPAAPMGLPASRDASDSAPLASGAAALGQADDRAARGMQAGEGRARGASGDLRVDVDTLSEVSPQLTRGTTADMVSPVTAVEDATLDDQQSWMYDESGVEAHTEESEMGSLSPGFRAQMADYSSPMKSAASSRSAASTPARDTTGGLLSPGASARTSPLPGSCRGPERTTSEDMVHEASMAAAAANALRNSNIHKNVVTGSYHFMADGSLSHTKSRPGSVASSDASHANSSRSPTHSLPSSPAKAQLAAYVRGGGALLDALPDARVSKLSNANLQAGFGSIEPSTGSVGLSFAETLIPLPLAAQAAEGSELTNMGLAALQESVSLEQMEASAQDGADEQLTALPTQPIVGFQLPQGGPPSTIEGELDVHADRAQRYASEPGGSLKSDAAATGLADDSTLVDVGPGAAPAEPFPELKGVVDRAPSLESTLDGGFDTMPAEHEAGRAMPQVDASQPGDAYPSGAAHSFESHAREGRALDPSASPPTHSSASPSARLAGALGAEQAGVSVDGFPADVDTAGLAALVDPLGASQWPGDPAPPAMDADMQASPRSAGSANSTQAVCTLSARPAESAFCRIASVKEGRSPTAAVQPSVDLSELERLGVAGRRNDGAQAPRSPPQTSALPGHAEVGDVPGSGSQRPVLKKVGTPPMNTQRGMSSLGTPFLTIDLGAAKSRAFEAFKSRREAHGDGGDMDRESSSSSSSLMAGLQASRAELLARGADSYAAGKALAKGTKDKLQKQFGNYADKFLGGFKKEST